MLRATFLCGFVCAAIWRLVATRVVTHTIVPKTVEHDVFPEIEYVLHFNRKPLYHVVNIVVPCCLLVIISLLVS